MGIGVGKVGERRGRWWEHGEGALATSKHLRSLGGHHGRARAGHKGIAKRLYTEESGNIRGRGRGRSQELTLGVGCLRRKGMCSEVHVTMRIAPL